MEDSDKVILELHNLVDKLNTEADRAIKYINTIRKKGTNEVRKAEYVLTESVRPRIRDQARRAVFQLIERLVEINCDLELADDESPNQAIPYLPAGHDRLRLQFLTGDNPWTFWLYDPDVDTRTLHKNLLKKYQNELLDPYPNPKPSESVCYWDRSKVFRGVVLQVINENRVKLLDCDSNMSKVVASDKLYRADPDACHIHASTLRCTIFKETSCSELWSIDLRDVFCNALKEAVLYVKIVERLPGNFPSFLVDVEMKSEDEECSGNLKDWIAGRLLPELNKLTIDKNDSVCDFLSSEALNPFHSNCDSLQEAVIETILTEANFDEIDETQPPQSPHKETNNLNTNTKKLAIEIVPNVDSTKDRLSPEANNLETENSREGSGTLNDTGLEVSNSGVTNDSPDNVNMKEKDEDSTLSCSSKEFRPINPQRQTNPVGANKTMKKMYYSDNSGYNNFPPSGMNYQQPYTTPAHMYTPFPPLHPAALLRGHLPWGYQGQPLQQGQAWHPPQPPQTFPLHPMQTYSPQPHTGFSPVLPQEPRKQPWSSGEQSQSNPRKEDNKDNVKIANFNNINVNVNVMAPEFVPKTPNEFQDNTVDKKSITDVVKTNCDTPVVPTQDEIVPIELRKPRSLLKPGENLMVIIAHVESPAEFYVHFVTKNNRYLDKLHDDMFTHYTVKEKVEFKSLREASNRLGKFCACKWLEDNHWYRVEVLDWAVGDNSVKVYFVDHGNTDCVPLSCLQPLTLQFAKLSMCAQPCHLAKVYPLKKNESWSEESIEFFKSKVEVNNTRIYSVTVVPSKEKQIKINSLSVLLYEGKATENSQSINDLMVDWGMAWSRHLLKPSSSTESELYHSLDDLPLLSTDTEQSKKRPALAPLPLEGPRSVCGASVEAVKPETDIDWERWDPLKEEYHSDRNNPALDMDDACVAVTGYSARDEARICKFFARSGFCWKDCCTQEHSMPNKDGVTTDKEEVYLRAFSEMALPRVGEKITVAVTAVSSISFFYVQLQQSKGVAADEDDNDAETLTSLHQFINTKETIQKMKHLKVPPALGQLVLAQCDNAWFRARIVSADDDTEVMFVDYGSISTVSEKDLREMEPRFLHLPFQAIECSLANIIPPEGGSESYEKATELLRDYVEGNILSAEVYDSGGISDEVRRLQVLLQLNNGVDVGEWLVDNGACQQRTISTPFQHLELISLN